MRLIDADALIPNEVHTIIRITATGEQIESVVYAEQIDNAPTVDAVPFVHGHWAFAREMMYCSECAAAWDRIYTIDYNYCPNCGAKMDEEEKNDSNR